VNSVYLVLNRILEGRVVEAILKELAEKFDNWIPLAEARAAVEAAGQKWDPSAYKAAGFKRTRKRMGGPWYLQLGGGANDHYGAETTSAG